jgi:hypothetical protein
VIVEIRIVGLDAVEQQIARLLEERIDREVEGVKGRVRRQLGGLALDVVEGGRERDLGGFRWRGNLVQERGEEVRVVDEDRDLDKNVPEGQLGLLQAACGLWSATKSPSRKGRLNGSSPLRCKLSLLVRRHELGRQSKRPQA